MRVDYRNDGQYLLRLMAAVTKDIRRTETWRRQTARMANRLAIRLLSADERSTDAKKKPAVGADKRGEKESSPVRT
jgi:hypothetical protein